MIDPRDILWGILEKSCFKLVYMDVIMEIFKELVTNVRIPKGLPQEFPTIVGLH